MNDRPHGSLVSLACGDLHGHTTALNVSSLRGEEARLEGLKSRVLLRQLDEMPDVEFHALVIRAANEAAALAQVTGYPLLIFPVLFQENVRAALAWAFHQARVRRQSFEMLSAAI